MSWIIDQQTDMLQLTGTVLASSAEEALLKVQGECNRHFGGHVEYEILSITTEKHVTMDGKTTYYGYTTYYAEAKDERA